MHLYVSDLLLAFDLLLFILLEHFELCLRKATLLSVGEHFLIPILSLFLELNSG